MSFNKTPKVEEKKYDLGDEKDLDLIKGFELELLDRTFKQYSFNKGFIRKDNRCEYVVVRNRVVEYHEAKVKMRCVEILRSRRIYKEKEEHLGQLSSLMIKCLKIGKERCMICYPHGLKDIQALKNKL